RRFPGWFAIDIPSQAWRWPLLNSHLVDLLDADVQPWRREVYAILHHRAAGGTDHLRSGSANCRSLAWSTALGAAGRRMATRLPASGARSNRGGWITQHAAQSSPTLQALHQCI